MLVVVRVRGGEEGEGGVSPELSEEKWSDRPLHCAQNSANVRLHNLIYS